jgi:hypothetical protein
MIQTIGSRCVRAMGEWTADFVTDPLRDHALCVDLQEDGEFQARVELTDEGCVLHVYPSADGVRVPAAWLAKLLVDVERELTEAARRRNPGTPGH